MTAGSDEKLNDYKLEGNLASFVWAIAKEIPAQCLHSDLVAKSPAMEAGLSA